MRSKQGALLDVQAAVQTQQAQNLAAEKLRTDAQTAQIVKETALADKKILQADQEIALVAQQVRVTEQEVNIAQAKLANIPKEGALLEAQARAQLQQIDNPESREVAVGCTTANSQRETANVPKQGALLDAQTEVQNQQKINLQAEKSLALMPRRPNSWPRL